MSLLYLARQASLLPYHESKMRQKRDDLRSLRARGDGDPGRSAQPTKSRPVIDVAMRRVHSSQISGLTALCTGFWPVH